MKKKLSELNIGESGYVHSYEDSDLQLKMYEMGCLPGEKITLLQSAPMGGPISIRIAGYNLSIRRCEAYKINISQD